MQSTIANYKQHPAILRFPFNWSELRVSVIVRIHVVYYPRASAGYNLFVVAGSLLDVQHHTAISVLSLHGLLMKLCLIAVCNCGS